MPQATADLVAVVVVFDWLETEFKDWKSPTDEYPFEVEYYCPNEQMFDHLREELEAKEWTVQSIEGPLVNAAVAVTVMVDTSADVDQLVRDVNSVIPWLHGPRGEVRKETENES